MVQSGYTGQWASLGPPPDSAFTAGIISEPTRGWSRLLSLKALLMWIRLRAVGRKGHLLVTCAQRSVSLVTALERCEAPSLMAFVESVFITCWQTWAPKTPFNTEQMNVRYSDFCSLGRTRNVCLAIGWCSSNFDCHRIVLITPSIHIGLIHESPGRETYTLGVLSSAWASNLSSGNYHIFYQYLGVHF